MPAALLDAAATLLAEGGPAALTTRRLATAVGTSTTAVYTHFGGMDDLVRALVREGFKRLHRTLGRVAITDDAVFDVIALGYAYRHNAMSYPHLYAVMFGASALAGFALADEDRQHGRYTLKFVVDAARRAMGQGRFRPDDAELVGQQLWIATHGLVTLELGGYLVEPYDAETVYQNQLCALLVGCGDEPAAARESMALARQSPGKPVA